MSDDPNMEQPTTGSLLGNPCHAERLRNAMLLLVHGTNILECSERRGRNAGTRNPLRWGQMHLHDISKKAPPVRGILDLSMAVRIS